MRNRILYICFFFVCLISFSSALAQNVKDTADNDNEVVDPDFQPLTKAGNTVRGKWYGIGNVITKGNTNSYLCELLLKEDKKGNVTGFFNYFFRDGYFSNKLYGSYDKTTQVLKFKPVILLYHQTVKADIGVDVPMFGNFNLNLNSKDTTLTGFLTPVSNYKYLVPPINVKLSIIGRNEPTLKERIKRRKLELEEDEDVATVLNQQAIDSAKKADSKLPKKADSKQVTSSNKNLKAGKLINSSNKNPNNGQFVAGNKTYSSSTNIQDEKIKPKLGDTLRFNDTQRKYGRDTIRFNDKQKITSVENDKMNDQVSTLQKGIEEAFHHRATNIANSLIVKDDSVTIVLYDNGEYDHDSVSVFFNGKLIASNVELKTNVPAKFVIHLDASPDAKNELTLFAENLGSLPPNSALMIITDSHDSRYEVNLKSDLSHNVSVLLTPKLH